MRRVIAVAAVAAGLILPTAGAVAQPDPQPTPEARPARGAAPHPILVTDRRRQPMRVVLVREDRPDCRDGCAEWISAEGDIDRSTPLLFEALFRAIGDRPLPVLIHSWGGSAEAGIEVGRILRKHGAAVAVARTLFTDRFDGAPVGGGGRAPAPFAHGRPVRGGDCFSACVFALAGGEIRLAGIGTRVGVHQARTEGRIVRQWKISYRVEDGRRVEIGRELIDEKREAEASKAVAPGSDLYKAFDAHFRSMGLADGLVPMMESVVPSRLRMLALQDLEQTRLTTGRGGVGDLLPQAEPILRRRLPMPRAGQPLDPYGPPVAWSSVAAAVLGIDGGTGRVALVFAGGADPAVVQWWARPTATSAPPSPTARLGFRLSVAGRSSGGEVPLVVGEGDEPATVAGRISIGDFCLVAEGAPVALRLLERPAEDAAPDFRMVSPLDPRDLQQMRATLCGAEYGVDPSPKETAPAAEGPVQTPAAKPRKASTTRS